MKGLILLSLLFMGCEGLKPEKGDLSFEDDGSASEELVGETPDDSPGDQNENTSPDEGNVEIKVSFKDLKSKVLNNYRCTRCHSGLNSESQVKKMVVAGEPEDSLLYQVMKEGIMPPRGKEVSTAHLEVVEQYILGL